MAIENPAEKHRDNLNNIRPEVATSYREMVTRVPYSARSSLERQSELAKPYDGSHYWAMEHWPGPPTPIPPRPPNPFPPAPPPPGPPAPPPPGPPVPGPGPPGPPSCVLSDIDGATIDDCSQKYIFQLSNGIVRSVSYTVRHVHPGDDLAAQYIDVYTQSGSRRSKTCGGHWHMGDDQIVIEFDEGEDIGIGTLHITAYMEAIECKSTLEAGTAICYADIRIVCPGCDDSEAVAFDDENTPDEVARGNSITLYITGTGFPYTWELTSGEEHFDLGAEITTDNNNSLTAHADACGSARIRVTDCADNTTDFSIRTASNPDSAWVYKNATCGLSGAGSYTGGSYEYELIDGYQKQTQTSTRKFAGANDCPETCGTLSTTQCTVAPCDSCDNCIDPCNIDACRCTNGFTCDCITLDGSAHCESCLGEGNCDGGGADYYRWWCNSLMGYYEYECV